MTRSSDGYTSANVQTRTCEPYIHTMYARNHCSARSYAKWGSNSFSYSSTRQQFIVTQPKVMIPGQCVQSMIKRAIHDAPSLTKFSTIVAPMPRRIWLNSVQVSCSKFQGGLKTEVLKELCSGEFRNPKSRQQIGCLCYSLRLNIRETGIFKENT